jgi:adenine-specific DNA-methyltransferase
MVEKLDRSFNISEDTLKQLKKLIPEAFKDCLVDIGALSEALSVYSGEDIDIDDNLFGLYWPGKRQAKRAAAIPPVETLVSVPEDGVDEKTTKNIYIEGENLEVLKIIRKAYLGKIKMIYIDPPYNTGNDFIYPDDFSETEESYKRRTGQIDENGVSTTTNKSSEGRFHSNWCSMMYPRLRLARDLLTDDGVIFISIDDNEVAQLRKICDEIFGEKNFRNTILTRRRIKSLNSQFASNGLYSMNVGFEYVLIYAKNDCFTMKPLRMRKANTSEKGRWDVFWSNADRPTMRYEILGFTPVTGQWRNSKEKADLAVKNYKFYQEQFESKMSLENYWQETGCCLSFIRRISPGTGKNGGVQHWIPPSDTALRTSNWTDIEVSQIHKEIDLPFKNPKARELIQELVNLSNTTDNSIILDFFSGSSTTAHAVMQLNAEDGGNRQFIMVQLQEKCQEKTEAYKAGFKNICEIGKERIRRAGKKIKEEAGLNAKSLDTGFKVFRLSPSNFKPVAPYIGINVKELPDWFSGDPLVEGWKPENLITEVMLKEGFPLDSTITELDVYKKNKVYQVSSDSCDHSLIICLDLDIESDTIEKLDLGELDIFICLDSAMKDQAKARLDDKGRIIVI